MEKLYQWILLFSAMVLLVLAESCQFPKSIRGRWYQNGNYEFEIHKHIITKKGECKARKGDRYLIQESGSDCARCLLIMKRHHNIIQYKESFCRPGNLRQVCQSMSMDTILHTAVREPYTPERCPFQGAYRLQYKNQSNSPCDHSDSRVRPCAGDAKFRFHFRHCQPNHNTYDQDMDFECLAKWKDGELYMYGKFTASWLTNRDSQYRCFMYRRFRNVVYLYVSADATCLALGNYRDVPFTMELNRDSRNWPQPTCTFPPWFSSHNWRDMSGRHVYHAETGRGQEVLMGHRKHKDNGILAKNTYRCMTDLNDVINNNSTFVGTSFTSHGCSSMYQCLQITKKQNGLVEIITGPMRRNEPQYCPMAEFVSHSNSNTSRHLLIPDNAELVTCPLAGHYQTEHTMSPSCHVEVLAQCNTTHNVQLVMSCQNKPKKVVSLECLLSWHNQSSKYVIMRDSASNTKAAHCFKITEKRSVIDMYLDPACNIGSWSRPLGLDRLVLSKNPEKCQTSEEGSRVDIIPSRPTGSNIHKQANESGRSKDSHGSTNQNSQTKSNRERRPSQRQGTNSPTYNIASDNPNNGCDIPVTPRTLVLVWTIFWTGVILRR